MKTDKRAFSGCEVRALQGDDGNVSISGYAAVFDSRSNDLGGFVEIIKQGAFDNVLDDDVRALFNHDPMYVLGRNKTTMSLSVDEKGLRYDIPSAPSNGMIESLVIEPMRRGDINQSSFAFKVAKGGDKWKEENDGTIVREIYNISKLYDVSPVTYPAYTSATSTVRSLDEFRNTVQNSVNENLMREKEQAKWRAHVQREVDSL